MADEQLCWSVSPGAPEVTVFLKGELDLATKVPVTRLLARVVRQGSPLVVVDLSELTFLDSSGLHCLLRASQEAATRNSRLVVTNATGIVRRLFAIAGVERELLGEVRSEEESERPVAS